MKIFITDTIDHPVECASAWRRFVVESSSHSFRSVATPEEADVILFVDCHMLGDDWRMPALRRHPLVREYPYKTMVYNEKDHPWCVLPGLYVSMPRHSFEPARQRSVPYWITTDPGCDTARRPDLLFSFIGSNTHRVREHIANLAHPRAVVDVSHRNVFCDLPSADFRRRRELFTQTVARSKFVLCPRGHGTSSIRMYEAMQAGRVPVVISDQWVPPTGPDWNSCIIRIPESDVRDIPRLLEEAESRYESMAESSASAYRAWFARDVVFDRMADCLQSLLDDGAMTARGRLNRQYWMIGLRGLRGDLRRRLRGLPPLFSRQRSVRGCEIKQG